jgi:predicted aspartyl protease
MAQGQSIVSTNYPYLPILVEIRGQQEDALALIDTGYTGNLVVPTTWLNLDLGFPDGRSSVELGDGGIVTGAPLYLGTLEIVGLLSASVRITVLGNEYILGRSILDRFEITLDRGQQVIVRP